MPIDQYRMSMEARPLRVLYTKYNPNEISTSLQLVRPLGRIRKERRPSSVVPGQKLPGSVPGSAVGHPDSGPATTATERVDFAATVDNRTKQDASKTGQVNMRNPSRCDFREFSSPSPVAGRSRTQDFQHKFKIAAARKPGQESPPLKSDFACNRKIVNLPLFRVNVKTYSGDTVVNKTVAKTRESLRKLMELHRAKLKPANLVTANIRNYEFSAPPVLFRNNTTIGTPSTLQPFPAKPMLKSRNRERGPKQHTSNHKQTIVPYSHRDSSFSLDLKSPTPDEDFSVCDKDHVVKPASADTFYETAPGDSLWSMAIRSDTSLTLGSTMHHLDTVIKSPGSDELRELSNVFRGCSTDSTWPSFDELHRMRSRSQTRTFRSRTSLSRPGTVLNDVRPGTVLNDVRPGTALDNVPETPEQAWDPYTADQTVASPQSPRHYSPQHPVLRYTSKKPSVRLHSIIVPSHTCMECTMCNLYQKDIETACPPNSPMSTQCPDPLLVINEDSPHATRTGVQRARAVKPEVLQLSRINMNDGMYVTEDSPAYSLMKAKG